MIKFLGRGAAAAMAFFMLAASGGAQAQVSQPVATVMDAAAVDRTAKPLGTSAAVAAANMTSAAASAVATITGTSALAQPVRAAAQTFGPQIGREAAWLYRNGWPLESLVGRYGVGAALDPEAHRIAVAVYHEARGESLQGQLAVARVIMNRAASGKYPASWCATVKQPWQFSFVNPRTGAFPYTDTNCEAWRKAVGITRLAVANAVPSLDTDVLWYHATYVAPSWGRRLTRVDKIGAHIFYRS